MGSVARIVVSDRSKVAEARRMAAAMTSRIGLDTTKAAEVALIVTEAGNNLVNHAQAGEMLLSTGGARGDNRFEILAIDRGPGMDVSNSMRDGFSTAGTRGEGLGAIARAAADFDVFSSASGTVLFASVESEPPSAHEIQFGSARVPKTGEQACGDDWCGVLEEGWARLLVADGLGHGVFAAEASSRATEMFEQERGRSAPEAVQKLHAALRGTRGAALAVAYIETSPRRVTYCGLGNITGLISSNRKTQHMVSMTGTAGHEISRIVPFQYEWPSGALVILHSDGLLSQLGIEREPAVIQRHPSVIAGYLYREFSRGRDDSTVVVAKAG